MTSSPEETGHLAELVGQKIREGTVLCLEGDLGTGKTLFVQSLARTLGVEGDVTSPTFNLMNVY
jgi:tRNA threonylcarbamoyladenosine biosynthesis protein TsaE